MSISDLIVVMKEGVVQQIGAPQEVYDDPKNLFVARFLGTPPINVFSGKISGGSLYIGDSEIAKVGNVSDVEVFIGIRPEGFVIDDGGSLTCGFSNLEVMGRDVSVVATHKEAFTPTVRAILPSDSKITPATSEISFSVKPEKLLVFDKATEERIYF